MKALLVSGETIQLHKDCGCLDELHSQYVPHWVHMDHVSRELNRQLLERGGDALLAAVGFAQEEAQRLQEKLRHMHIHGIAQLIKEEGDKL